MPFDRVNRDDELEQAFAKHNSKYGKERPHIENLYRIFLQIKGYDLQEIRVRLFRTTQSGLWFAGEYWKGSDLVSPEEHIFYEYTEWFFMNRLLNTGIGGFAKCERNPIFVRPKPKRAAQI